MGEIAKRISRGKVTHEEKVLTHVDLFSGIGGFALATGWAGFRTVAFCEIELFCQEVLRARFGAITDTTRRKAKPAKPGGLHAESGEANRRPPLLIPDIRTLDGSRFRGATLLTGGVPCQPVSVAGKRRGTADDRWLWPEAIRILGEVKPAWAIFENPPGILSLEQGVVFEDLLAQMEGEGYEVQSVIIPACAVNAPHRRDRVWILAHNTTDSRCLNGGGDKQGRQIQNTKVRKVEENEPERNGWIGGTCKRDGDVASAQDPLLGGDGGWGDGDTPRLRRALQTAGSDSDAPDAERFRCQVGEWVGDGKRRGQEQEGTHAPEGSWDIPWIEVATRLCRVDARVSNRVDRLKALGNAIVPQVAYQIIKAISEIEGMSI